MGAYLMIEHRVRVRITGTRFARVQAVCEYTPITLPETSGYVDSNSLVRRQLFREASVLQG